MKKLVSIVLALAMILMVAAASAATVTVSNPGVGKTYTYYKVFDVTYGNGQVATSYTKKGETDNFLSALQGEDSPFTVEASIITGVYNIGVKSGKTDVNIRDWLQGKASMLTAHTGDDFEDGYYLMMVQNGDQVIERATTFEIKGADITIIDKNQTIPGPDKQESVDGGNNYKYVGLDYDEATVPTQEIGGIVNYKVVGTFSKFVETDMVKKLKFVDTMSKGLTFDGTSSVTLKINGNPVTPETLTASVDSTTGVTTLTIEKATVDSENAFLYNAENTYELTYTAHINEDAIDNNAETEENEVVFSYNLGGENDIEAGRDDTKVKSYDLSLEKIDGQDSTKKLPGAKFKVYPATGSTPINLVLVSGTGTEDSTVDNVYRLADADDASTDDVTIVTEMVTGITGKIVVKGLKNGSYEFEETEAPKGYNKLTGRTAAQTITNANVSFTVANNKGTELPSTGGIGTTIFYIVGGLLLVGAAVILVARRKAHD